MILQDRQNFSKEHLRTLEIIFEHFARLLATNLPAYLRKSVTVDVVNWRLLFIWKFSMHYQIRSAWRVGTESVNGNIIMEMASNLGFAIVDRLLGGEGKSLEKERDFSEIELSILERIFSICVNLMQGTLDECRKISPRIANE